MVLLLDLKMTAVILKVLLDRIYQIMYKTKDERRRAKGKNENPASIIHEPGRIRTRQ